MSYIDKNQAVIDFLMTCPYIQQNPLFFNFINAKDNNKQLATVANDKVIDKPFIDGSVQKRFTFTIIDYKSVAYTALVNLGTSVIGTSTPAYLNENVEDMMDVQQIIDWITEQDDAGNYPDFGTTCDIQDMKAATDNPNMNGVDTSVTPALAKYSVSIQINYIDTSKVIWNN